MEGDVSRVSPLRMYDAVNVVLSYQNHDGGWATYENTRSFHALEVPPPLCPALCLLSSRCLQLHTCRLLPRRYEVWDAAHALLTYQAGIPSTFMAQAVPTLLGRKNGRVVDDERAPQVFLFLW